MTSLRISLVLLGVYFALVALASFGLAIPGVALGIVAAIIVPFIVHAGLT